MTKVGPTLNTDTFYNYWDQADFSISKDGKVPVS